ncbi:hypothetical protein RSAG8_06733, partial [Rhizoctonia solani AG-8 WAC10335]
MLGSRARLVWETKNNSYLGRIFL